MKFRKNSTGIVLNSSLRMIVLTAQDITSGVYSMILGLLFRGKILPNTKLCFYKFIVIDS